MADYKDKIDEWQQAALQEGPRAGREVRHLGPC